MKVKKRIKAIRTLLEFDNDYSKETAVFDLKQLEEDMVTFDIVSDDFNNKN